MSSLVGPNGLPLHAPRSDAEAMLQLKRATENLARKLAKDKEIACQEAIVTGVALRHFRLAVGNQIIQEFWFLVDGKRKKTYQFDGPQEPHTYPKLTPRIRQLIRRWQRLQKPKDAGK